MNENMNNQATSSVEPVMQQPVQPSIQQPMMQGQSVPTQQPMMQSQFAPIQQPMMQNQSVPTQQPTMQNQPAPTQKSSLNMNNIKEKIKNMDKDKTLKIAGMICGVLILLGVFLPYLSVEILGYKTTANIWESEMKIYRFVLLLFSAVTVATYFLQKAKSLALISSGMAFGFAITVFDASESFEGAGIGYWALLLGSIGLIVIAVIENLDEIKSIYVKNNTVVSGQPVQSVQQVQHFAPSAVPVNLVTPVVQNITVCNNCGQPKKNPNDQFCQSCGQRY